MPRKKFFPSEAFPYHVSCRCPNKQWFPLPLDEVWDIFSIYLYFVTMAFGVRIHAFVLMDNHFHLLVSTPNANLDKAMNYLLREVSKRINDRSGKINQVFGGPYHWSLIKSRKHFEIVYKYVYRNPIEAGLSKSVTAYSYTTITRVLGYKKMEFPVFDNTTLIQNTHQQLIWLNTPYPDELFLFDLRDALSKKEFTLETRA